MKLSVTLLFSRKMKPTDAEIIDGLSQVPGMWLRLDQNAQYRLDFAARVPRFLPAAVSTSNPNNLRRRAEKHAEPANLCVCAMVLIVSVSRNPTLGTALVIAEFMVVFMMRKLGVRREARAGSLNGG